MIVSIVVTVVLYLFFLFASFYLPRLAQRLYSQKYGLHLIFKSSFDNTIESDIRRKKIMRYANIVRFCCIFFLYFYLFFYVRESNLLELEFLWGFLSAIFAISISQSLMQIMIYRYVIRYPEVMEGMVYLKGNTFLSKLVMFNLVPYGVFVTVLTYFSPTNYMIGVLIGVFMLVIFSVLSSLTNKENMVI